MLRLKAMLRWRMIIRARELRSEAWVRLLENATAEATRASPYASSAGLFATAVSAGCSQDQLPTAHGDYHEHLYDVSSLGSSRAPSSMASSSLVPSSAAASSTAESWSCGMSVAYSRPPSWTALLNSSQESSQGVAQPPSSIFSVSSVLVPEQPDSSSSSFLSGVPAVPTPIPSFNRRPAPASGSVSSASSSNTIWGDVHTWAPRHSQQQQQLNSHGSYLGTTNTSGLVQAPRVPHPLAGAPVKPQPASSTSSWEPQRLSMVPEHPLMCPLGSLADSAAASATAASAQDLVAAQQNALKSWLQPARHANEGKQPYHTQPHDSQPGTWQASSQQQQRQQQQLTSTAVTADPAANAAAAYAPDTRAVAGWMIRPAPPSAAAWSATLGPILEAHMHRHIITYSELTLVAVLAESSSLDRHVPIKVCSVLLAGVVVPYCSRL